MPFKRFIDTQENPAKPPQVITEPDERYDEYCASSDFIREHIFPGGHLPSMGAMVEAARPTQLQARPCSAAVRPRRH